jgi:hypothetical protein
VDVAGLVRREKRRGAVRRTALLATAVVALSGAAGLGLTMAGGTGASSPPVAMVSPSPAVSPPDLRFRLVADTADSAKATAARLAKAFDGAFRKEAPGARWIYEPDYPGETGPDDRPPSVAVKVRHGVPSPAGEMFFSGSGVLNEGRKGGLHLSVVIFPGPDEVRAGTAYRDPMTCPKEQVECTEGTTPTGAKTVVWTNEGEALNSDLPLVVYRGRVALPDGRVLQIEHHNEFGPDGAPPAQRETPLTRDQVMAIAITVASQIKA